MQNKYCIILNPKPAFHSNECCTTVSVHGFRWVNPHTQHNMTSPQPKSYRLECSSDCSSRMHRFGVFLHCLWCSIWCPCDSDPALCPCIVLLTWLERSRNESVLPQAKQTKLIGKKCAYRYIYIYIKNHWKLTLPLENRQDVKSSLMQSRCIQCRLGIRIDMGKVQHWTLLQKICHPGIIAFGASDTKAKEGQQHFPALADHTHCHCPLDPKLLSLKLRQ